MSKEVKRYDPYGYDGLSALMHEDADGGWVRSENYDALRLELAEASADFVRIANERDALLAERDALAKDAERYRWLRNPDQDVALVLDKMVSSGVYEYRAGDELDAAIDAAMQGDQQ